MRVISRPVLRRFWERHADAADPLKSWLSEAEGSDWGNPRDIKDRYAGASVIGDNRVVFDICGGRYRLVVHFHYAYQIARIRFIGTHADYDRIDAATI
jgi:mRNA interferase HigB